MRKSVKRKQKQKSKAESEITLVFIMNHTGVLSSKHCMRKYNQGHTVTTDFNSSSGEHRYLCSDTWKILEQL